MRSCLPFRRITVALVAGVNLSVGVPLWKESPAFAQGNEGEVPAMEETSNEGLVNNTNALSGTNTANANTANALSGEAPLNDNTASPADSDLANAQEDDFLPDNAPLNGEPANDFSLGDDPEASAGNNMFAPLETGETPPAVNEAPAPPEPLPNNASPLATTREENTPLPDPPAENVSAPNESEPAEAAEFASETPVPSPADPSVASASAQMARELATKLKDLPLGSAPEEYVVQPGDTLWDISDQFLDDPFWWPKLWSLNAEDIPDPNLIYPGMVLVFTPSDGAKGPALSARDTEILINPVSLESSSLQSTNPLANSWRGGRDGDLLDPDSLPKDEGVLSVGDFQASTAYAFRIPGFMTSERIDSVGEVLPLASSPAVAIVGSVTFASFKTPPKEGERYLALRKVDDILAPNGDRPGVPLYIYAATVGVVHLNASGVASLFVESGPQGASPGDVLVPFRNLYVQVNPGTDTRKSSLKSRVVGVLDENLSLAGEAQAVFLEKEGAVAVGEEVDLYMPPGGAPLFGEDEGTLDRVKVGSARIVEVGNETVTAVVLTATREISVGASTQARP